MPVDHYENFPVASFLVPARLRRPIEAIYRFARSADDIADEGNASDDERLAGLAAFRRELDGIASGAATDSFIFSDLASAVAEFKLPLSLFQDLLDAFSQDVVKKRYADYPELLDYCRRSANPVGRLMLQMAGVHDARSLQQSDAICSALQLINFWQDPSVDLPRGRHYLTDADCAAHGVARADLARQDDGPATQALLRELCDWAGALMAEGAPLACRVPGRLGWELRLVVQGGLRILERIAAMHYRTLRQRPTLGATDLPVMLWRAARMRPARPTPGFRLA